MKIIIDKDEVYPVYYISRPTRYDDKVYHVSNDLYERAMNAEKEFDAVQRILKGVENEQS